MARYEEQLDDYIADLVTDIRCAERDGMLEYASKCRRELAELTSGREVRFDQYGMPRLN